MSNPFVMVDEPFVGISLNAAVTITTAMATTGDDQQAVEIETMLKVMAIIENDGKKPTLAEAAPRRAPRVGVRFEMPGENVH